MSDVEHGTDDIFGLLLCDLTDATLSMAGALGSTLGGTGAETVRRGTP